MKNMFVFIVLIVVIFTILDCGFSEKETPLDEKYDSTIAYFEAHEFIKKHLKAPFTAKFPHPIDAEIHKVNDTTFTIFSYVDSENSFGSKMRVYYSCQLIYLDEINKVRCDDIVFF